MKTRLTHTLKIITLLFIVLLVGYNKVYSSPSVGCDEQFSFPESTVISLKEIEQSTKITVQEEKEITIEMRDGKMFFNKNVHVLLAEIEASQGIVHLKQGVWIPPSFNETGNIVQVAQNTPEFLKLAEAVIATNLVSVLKETYKLTVLAPTNVTFEVLDLLSEIKMLTNVLLLHFIADEFTFENLTEKHRITTLASSDVRLIKGNEHHPDRVREVKTNSKADFVV
ncbi:fasciclin domain-containing protein [Ascidiimonas sp. W6]|uniref:fasciclin domain-containing protein n=1 Tax=Ascidiimonas meishanensis TaxID=3128903 RepID=UPI0030EDA928